MLRSAPPAGRRGPTQFWKVVHHADATKAQIDAALDWICANDSARIDHYAPKLGIYDANPTIDVRRMMERVCAYLVAEHGVAYSFTWNMPLDQVADILQADYAMLARLPVSGTMESTPSVPNGEWSEPMSKADFARRVYNGKKDRSRDAEPLLKQYGTESVGNKVRVRLDTMDKLTRSKIENPTP